MRATRIGGPDEGPRGPDLRESGSRRQSYARLLDDGNPVGRASTFAFGSADGRAVDVWDAPHACEGRSPIAGGIPFVGVVSW
jgi:hypothetical protein